MSEENKLPDYWGYWQLNGTEEKQLFFIKLDKRARGTMRGVHFGTMFDALGVANFHGTLNRDRIEIEMKYLPESSTSNATFGRVFLCGDFNRGRYEGLYCQLDIVVESKGLFVIERFPRQSVVVAGLNRYTEDLSKQGRRLSELVR